MAERRYTDEEVAAIFKQASENEQAAVAPHAERQGMTLAALHEIGREVGLSAASISQAARALDHSGRPASRKFLGLPIGVGRTVELPGPMADAEWESLVADLRSTFQAAGSVRYDGPFRQWTNGNLQALVEPTETGHRIRLQTVKGDSLAMMGAGGALLGTAVATLTVFAVMGGLGNSAVMTGVALMSTAGIAMFASGALRVSGWARRRRVQFAEVVTRLSARSQSPA